MFNWTSSTAKKVINEDNPEKENVESTTTSNEYNQLFKALRFIKTTYNYGLYKQIEQKAFIDSLDLSKFGSSKDEQVKTLNTLKGLIGFKGTVIPLQAKLILLFDEANKSENVVPDKYPKYTKLINTFKTDRSTSTGLFLYREVENEEFVNSLTLNDFGSGLDQQKSTLNNLFRTNGFKSASNNLQLKLNSLLEPNKGADSSVQYPKYTKLINTFKTDRSTSTGLFLYREVENEEFVNSLTLNDFGSGLDQQKSTLNNLFRTNGFKSASNNLKSKLNSLLLGQSDDSVGNNKYWDDKLTQEEYDVQRIANMNKNNALVYTSIPFIQTRQDDFDFLKGNSDKRFEISEDKDQDNVRRQETYTKILKNTSIKRACCRQKTDDGNPDYYITTVRMPFSAEGKSMEELEKLLVSAGKYGSDDIDVFKKYGINYPFFHDKQVPSKLLVHKSMCPSGYNPNGDNANEHSKCQDFYNLYCYHGKREIEKKNGGNFNQNEYLKVYPDCGCYVPYPPELPTEGSKPMCAFPSCNNFSKDQYLDNVSRGTLGTGCTATICNAIVNASKVTGDVSIDNVNFVQNCGQQIAESEKEKVVESAKETVNENIKNIDDDNKESDLSIDDNVGSGSSITIIVVSGVCCIIVILLLVAFFMSRK